MFLVILFFPSTLFHSMCLKPILFSIGIITMFFFSAFGIHQGLLKIDAKTTLKMENIELEKLYFNHDLKNLFIFCFLSFIVDIVGRFV